MFLVHIPKLTRRSQAEHAINLSQRRAWFEGDPDADPDPAPPPAKGKSKDETAEAKFTQADLDHQLAKRAKEAKQATLNELLKELGVTDLADIKTKIAKTKEQEDKEKSELQKAQDALKAAEEKAETEAKRAADAEAARIMDKVNSKIERLAQAAKAANPEDVVDYLRNHHKDEVAALVGEDGTINEKGAEKLIETAKKARPHWFAVGGPGSPSNRDGKPPKPDAKQFGDKPLVRW